MTNLKENTRLVLAPMQGLIDDVMRDLLTRIGGYDECVSPYRAFPRHMVKIYPRNRQRKQNVFRHALHRPAFGQRCGQYGGECAGSRPLRCRQNRFELRLPRTHRQQAQRRRNTFKRAATDIPYRQNDARTFARTYSSDGENAARL